MILPTCPSCGARVASAQTTCLRCTAAGLDETRSVVEEAPTSDLVRALQFEETGSVPTAEPLDAGDGVQVEIGARLEYAYVPRGSDPIVNVLVDVTPIGPSLLSPGAGPVAHVILLLDVSASMNHPDKYPMLTEALSGMLHDLSSPRSADVLLSVVLFAYGSEAIFREVPAATLVPRDVLAKIDASPLRFGRYTDAAGALRIAGHIAADRLRVNRSMPTRIYLLTDGRPQDLPRTRERIARLATLPVDVDALAFGADADLGLLQELVSGGRGGTVKQVRPDTLGDAFDRIAEVAQRVVGNRALVEFELAPGVIASAAYRYRPGRHKFPEDAFQAGAVFRTDLGALESGRTYSLLFEVRMPESTADLTDLGRVSVRMRGAQVPRTFSARISVPRSAGDTLPQPDADVRAARDVLAALSSGDAETQLRALRVRRELYVAERRDPRVIAVIDRALELLEKDGSLAALSEYESATLRSHTCTAGGARPPVARRELAAG